MIKKNNKGITLIALVITIIVLLILASVSIAILTGDNGILTRARDAKIETALGAVKEQVRLYQIEKKMNEQEVTAESLLAEGKVSRTVQAGEEDKYYMYYALKENSFEGMQGLGKGNIASLKDVFLIDDNLNIKYISADGKEYGYSLNNKVLEDETEIRFSSKAFSEYVSKISGVTEEEMKFKWMKNQTNLVISDPNIESLQDLVFFPNLKNLTLQYLKLDNLNGIENCTKLVNFKKMWDTNIKDFEKLKELKNLEKVYLNQGRTEDFNNFIESIKDLSNLTSLTIDDCSWIKDISPIKKLKNLQILYLDRINFESLDGIKELHNLKQLSIIKSTKLKSLEGIEELINLNLLRIESNSEINNIEKISDLNNLKELYLKNNNIIDITPLSANTELTILDLRGNANLLADKSQYTEDGRKKIDEIGKILDRGGKIYLDVDKLKLFNNYRELDLSNQNLTTLNNLEGLTNLEILNLQSNKITLEDEKSRDILSSMTKLRSLKISNNCISNLKCIKNLNNIKNLEVSGQNNNFNMKDIENIIPNLTHLTISQDTLNTITNCSIDYITTLPIYGSNIKKLPDLSKFTKLQHIDLLGNAIENLEEIEKLTSLRSIRVGNDLHGKSLNFENMANMKSLELGSCNIWTEDLKNIKLPKNNFNMNLGLSNNLIIDATPLLELNSNTKINLSNNINLSQDSKDKLKAKFRGNVTF